MKTDELYQEDYASLGYAAKLKWLWFWWTWRLLVWLGHKINRPWWGGNGRHSDMDPDVCPDCGRVWRVRDLVHTYADDGTGEDVVGVDECPDCGCEM
jgi:hypothetical protein